MLILIKSPTLTVDALAETPIANGILLTVKFSVLLVDGLIDGVELPLNIAVILCKPALIGKGVLIRPLPSISSISSIYSSST